MSLPDQFSLPAPATPLDDEHPPPSFESCLEQVQTPSSDSQHHNQIRNQNQVRQADSDAQSLLPPYSTAKYGIHKSEAEYLTALRAWAEEKSYDKADSQGGLVGFYGSATMEERNSKLKEENRKAKEEKQRSRRRSEIDEAQPGAEEQRQRRKSGLSQWLGRRRRTSSAA